LYSTTIISVARAAKRSDDGCGPQDYVFTACDMLSATGMVHVAA
jgi:hypothetical protein